MVRISRFGSNFFTKPKPKPSFLQKKKSERVVTGKLKTTVKKDTLNILNKTQKPKEAVNITTKQGGTSLFKIDKIKDKQKMGLTREKRLQAIKDSKQSRGKTITRSQTKKERLIETKYKTNKRRT